MTFLTTKRNLEIGLSERLLPILGTKNRILKIGSCERTLTFKTFTLNVLQFYLKKSCSFNTRLIEAAFAVIVICIVREESEVTYFTTMKKVNIVMRFAK